MSDEEKTNARLSKIWTKVVNKTLGSTTYLVSKAKHINVKAGLKKVFSATRKALGATLNVSGNVGRGIGRGIVYMGKSYQAGYRSVNPVKKNVDGEKSTVAKGVPKKRTGLQSKKMVNQTSNDFILEKEVDRIVDQVSAV